MPGSQKEYQYWGRFASKHDSGFIYIAGPAITQEIKDWLINQFKDSDVVLALGCGAGLSSGVIADRVKHLTATDLSQEMIKQIKKKHLKGWWQNVEVRRTYSQTNWNC